MTDSIDEADQLVRDLAYSMQKAYRVCKTKSAAIAWVEKDLDCNFYSYELSHMWQVLDAFADICIPDWSAFIESVDALPGDDK